MAENLFLPKTIEYQPGKENKNKGTVVITPCYPGYGTTLGSALRRVLLSSLAGVAIDAVKIKGARHEFGTLPGIKEDLLEIILNLKAVRFKPKVELPHPLVLEFKTQKEGIVKAREILTGPEVEVVNPNLKIAEITDKKASLGMKLWLAKGYGWVSADEKSREGREEGTIIIDSIFNPVFKVAPQIENVRVGKRNDYEKLSLVIETDSTLSPLEAFLKAVDLLAEEFTFLKKGGEKLLGVKKETTKKIKKKVVKTKKEK